MIWTLTQVAIGGAAGSLVRFLTVHEAPAIPGTGFPYGTVLVNVVGSFAMGVLAVTLADRGLMQQAPLLMDGLLGGFTTFSAFSLNAVGLWQRGDAGLAAAYLAGSVGLSIAALAFGMTLRRGAMA